MLDFLSLSHAAEIPKELADAVVAAETDGRAVFEAARRPEPATGPVISNARKQISNFCNFDYRPIQVSLQGKTTIYFLAQSSSPDEIIVGRHFKVVGPKVAESTKSCFTLGRVPANAAAAFTTHLLSPAPNEFHVYLSLKHGKGIIVGTSAGNWAVEKGKIRFLDKRGR
jgi:hypothetical protein